MSQQRRPKLDPILDARAYIAQIVAINHRFGMQVNEAAAERAVVDAKAAFEHLRSAR